MYSIDNLKAKVPLTLLTILQSNSGDYPIQHRNILRRNSSLCVLQQSGNSTTILLFHPIHIGFLCSSASNIVDPVRADSEDAHGSS